MQNPSEIRHHVDETQIAYGQAYADAMDAIRSWTTNDTTAWPNGWRKDARSLLVRVWSGWPDSERATPLGDHIRALSLALAHGDRDFHREAHKVGLMDSAPTHKPGPR